MLIIRELTYLDHVTENALMGGNIPLAITGTITKAKPGSASANAFALANGQYIAVETTTQVITGSRLNLANATAEAYAVSGNNTALSLSLGNSTSLTNRYSGLSSTHSVSFSLATTN